ncbi:MAG: hypothetical protein KKE39_14130 [Bacteroidetes bacterium]|nr:hypothetical protein [Bacteroidota bacterium]MBU1373183.1 hypothetical protein [Bacteroidota bacterium]MBU1486255.1 hypothetical protein [Bacteroidota bacterium]MBU1761314.1 hypothetical protein [Bacteroidota bacterium]MBU2045808.1 hypothetical protein [Bacteroidota bacterium]
MPLLFSLLFNDLSAWWLIPCFILGFGLAFVLYQKSALEDKKLKWILFSLRGILLSLLAFLLLSPLIKLTQKQLEKPLIIIAQDASASIKSATGSEFDSVAYHHDLENLAKSIGENSEVKILNFGDEVKEGFDFKQTEKQTDFSILLHYIQEQYVDRNIGALILSSDGIINRGANPINQISQIKYPIYSIALGDTIPKRDLILAQVNYNNLVYLGNDHQLTIEVQANKANGTKSQLVIKTNDGQTQAQYFTVNGDEWRQKFTINLEARKKGIQKIEVQVVPVKDEFSVQNNRQTIFVNVLDGREKVLILADAPHPDISALRTAIENNKNYEVKIAYADDLPANIQDYGLIIFHSLPSVQHPITSFLSQTRQKSRWFIVGTNTNTSALSQNQSLLNINAPGNATQDYLSQLNKDFYAFSLNDDTKERLQNLAPLVAPFGNYSLKSAGIVLFNQKVGNVVTPAPLLSFGDDGGAKIAVLTGEGIWRWRLEDFAKNDNHDAVDELISKSVQYLNAKDDKRKFRVYPIKDRFAENEHIILNAELYNDAYELNNEPDVSIDIQSKSGKKYSYLFSRVGQSYQLDAGFLPSDEYSFAAKAVLGKNSYAAKGDFLIEELNAELMHTTANHQLLYNMAVQSGGKMVMPNQISLLKDIIPKNEKVKTISYEEHSYENIINLKWIFIVLMLLLSLEWFLRKRNGAI